MTTRTDTASSAYHPDDIAVWPDGTWISVGELSEGGYGHKSDDYEIVPLEDVERLRELGIADELS
ncbi:hypothetical protein [Mesorhizobium sp.]|uniref:hypothetical protein n=1 Tax=Mesorhizobium sp. TaxID=1871066 RepID=UPI000FE58472|nr:hypothetical protein [Mesorhizobium sp.]RWK66814.1 MAG: hypothetical protein EOR54_22390 [Mesorhizobium sp.]